MALLTEISEMNRVDEQGNTWEIDIKPIGCFLNDNGVMIYQWSCSVSLTKSYRYVGLTKEAAEEAAVDIREAYKKQRSKFISRWDRSSRKWTFQEVQLIEEEQVDVTPRSSDKVSWDVEVSVHASTSKKNNTTYSGRPTIADVKALLSDVSDYPELDEEEAPPTM